MQLVKHRVKRKAHLHGLDVEPACMIDAIWLRIIRQLPIMMQKM